MLAVYYPVCHFIVLKYIYWIFFVGGYKKPNFQFSFQRNLQTTINKKKMVATNAQQQQDEPNHQQHPYWIIHGKYYDFTSYVCLQQQHFFYTCRSISIRAEEIGYYLARAGIALNYSKVCTALHKENHKPC